MAKERSGAGTTSGRGWLWLVLLLLMVAAESVVVWQWLGDADGSVEKFPGQANLGPAESSGRVGVDGRTSTDEEMAAGNRGDGEGGGDTRGDAYGSPDKFDEVETSGDDGGKAASTPQSPATSAANDDILNLKRSTRNEGTYTFRTVPIVASDAALRLAATRSDVSAGTFSTQGPMLHTASPDAEGRYRCDVGEGRHSGSIEIAGYAPINVRFEMKAGELVDGGTFHLLASAEMVGRVVDSQGAGVASAFVTAVKIGRKGPESDSITYGSGRWNSWRVATSDAEGWFSVKDLPPVRLSLTASKEGFTSIPGYSLSTHAVYTRENPLLIQMAEGGRLAGEVIGLTEEIGKAALDVHLRVHMGMFFPEEVNERMRDRIQKDWLKVRILRADNPAAVNIVTGLGRDVPPDFNSVAYAVVKDGKYESGPLGPGTYFASLTVGSVSEVRRVEIVGGRNSREDWNLGGTGTITGRVTRKDGMPLKDVTVYALPAGLGKSMPSRTWRERRATATTSSDGSYEMTIGAGHWELRVREHDEAIPEGEKVPPFGALITPGATARCDIQLDVTDRVKVTVRFVAGEGTEFSKLRVDGPGEFSAASDGDPGGNPIGDGWFDLGMRVPGKYQVTGYPTPKSRPWGSPNFFPNAQFEVPAGLAEFRHEIVLVGVPFNGRVATPDGKGISGVNLMLSSRGAMVGGQFGCKSGDDGSFTFPWVANGRYRMSVSHSGEQKWIDVDVPHAEVFLVTMGGPRGSVLVKIVGRTGEPIGTPYQSGNATLTLPSGEYVSTEWDEVRGSSLGPVGSSTRLAKAPVGRLRLLIRVDGFCFQFHWIEVKENEETLVNVTLTPAAQLRVVLPAGEYTTAQLAAASLTIPNGLYDPEVAKPRQSTIGISGSSFVKNEATGRWTLERYMSVEGIVDLSFTMGGSTTTSWQVRTTLGQLTETTVVLIPE